MGNDPNEIVAVAVGNWLTHWRSYPVLALTQLLQRMGRVIAFVLGGVALAIAVIRVLAAQPAEVPGFAVVFLLAAAAVLCYGAAVGLSFVSEHMAEGVAAERAARLPRLSAEERERERFRETPRLAREYGPALRAPSADDPPAGGPL